MHVLVPALEDTNDGIACKLGQRRDRASEAGRERSWMMDDPASPGGGVALLLLAAATVAVTFPNSHLDDVSTVRVHAQDELA